MIKKIELHNWKSFIFSELYIDPLTFIIGTNASGKSNMLDALFFLKQAADGVVISDIGHNIRGGTEGMIRNGEKAFTLKVEVENRDCELHYTLSCRKNASTLEIIDEILIHREEDEELTLFATKVDEGSTDTSSRTVQFYVENKVQYKRKMEAERFSSRQFYVENKAQYKHLEVQNSRTILSQINSLNTNKYVKRDAIVLAEHLKNIFILDPLPYKMRSFSALATDLASNASNIAGVLAALPEDEKKEVEQCLSEYVRHLPEKDLQRIWAERVGVLGTDAMLYCEEEWLTSQTQTVDARSMSDGTLRFTAIALALLVGKAGSLLVIEEVDNGLHPSRAKELVEMLRELGARKNIDILCTTHNPQLIDTLGREMLPFISYVERSPDTGASQVKLLEDLKDLPRLMASGSIGRMMFEDKLHER